MARLTNLALILLIVASTTAANGWPLIISMFLGGLALGALGVRSRFSPAGLVTNFLVAGIAVGAFKVADRLGNPMAYPPIVLLDGLWFAAVFVASAAAGALVAALFRRQQT